MAYGYTIQSRPKPNLTVLCGKSRFVSGGGEGSASSKCTNVDCTAMTHSPMHGLPVIGTLFYFCHVQTARAAISVCSLYSGRHSSLVLCTYKASGDLRQQYVEPRHLAKQYTCIAWHRPSSKVSRNAETIEASRRILCQQSLYILTATGCAHIYYQKHFTPNPTNTQPKCACSCRHVHVLVLLRANRQSDWPVVCWCTFHKRRRCTTYVVSAHKCRRGAYRGLPSWPLRFTIEQRYGRGRHMCLEMGSMHMVPHNRTLAPRANALQALK